MPKVTRYDSLPEHMQEGARRYVEQGVWPGDFLRAVLCDSLTEAFARADHINIACIGDWVLWLHNDCPVQAWGAEKVVQMWVERGGLEGHSTPRDPA